MKRRRQYRQAQGEFELLNGEQTVQVGAGSLHYVPKTTLHAHKYVGEGVGRMLIILPPDGLYEHFFEAVGKPVDDGGGPLVFGGQPDVERIIEGAAEQAIEMPVLSHSVSERELDRLRIGSPLLTRLSSARVAAMRNPRTSDTIELNRLWPFDTTLIPPGARGCT